jgi:hypothetical protein
MNFPNACIHDSRYQTSNCCRKFSPSIGDWMFFWWFFTPSRTNLRWETFILNFLTDGPYIYHTIIHVILNSFLENDHNQRSSSIDFYTILVWLPFPCIWKIPESNIGYLSYYANMDLWLFLQNYLLLIPGSAKNSDLAASTTIIKRRLKDHLLCWGVR